MDVSLSESGAQDIMNHDHVIEDSPTMLRTKGHLVIPETLELFIFTFGQ